MRVSALVLFTVLVLSAKSGSGQGDGQLMADLDGDGKAEIISWHLFAKEEENGTFYQLRVSDSTGAVIWEGADLKDVEHPMVFGEWHFGISMPQLVGDIDQDGKIELVAPEPQSDVSPTWFRVLEWRHGRFYLSRSAALLETPKGSGKFVWTGGEEYLGTWISKFFVENRDGTFEVQVYTDDGGANADVTTETVTPTEDGFERKAGAMQQSPNKPAGELEDWVKQQRWYVKLSDSLPKGVSLIVETYADDPEWSDVEIREIHAPDSGYDPNVAPMIGQFRVSADRKRVQWFNPVDASWSSLPAFFESRGMNLLAE